MTRLSGFSRLEKYTRVRRKAKVVNGKLRPAKASLRDVLTEAMRTPGECPHITDVRSPELIFGANPVELIDEIESCAANARDPLGRKIRKNACLLLTAVMSYPISRKDIEANDAEKAVCDRWCVAVLKFLEDQFGAHLHSVVRHVDESYVHLHGFARPLFSLGETTLDRVHPGERAEAAAARKSDRSGKARKLADRAYWEAIRQYQDHYYLQVGIYFGHARSGPKGGRKERSEWLASRHREELVQKALLEAQQIREMNEIQAEAVRREVQEEIATMMVRAECEINLRRDALEREWRKIEDLGAQVRNLLARLKKATAAMESRGLTRPVETQQIQDKAEPILARIFSEPS